MLNWRQRKAWLGSKVSPSRSKEQKMNSLWIVAHCCCFNATDFFHVWPQQLLTKERDIVHVEFEQLYLLLHFLLMGRIYKHLSGWGSNLSVRSLFKRKCMFFVLLPTKEHTTLYRERELLCARAHNGDVILELFLLHYFFVSMLPMCRMINVPQNSPNSSTVLQVCATSRQ